MTWRSLVRLLPGVGGFFYLSFPGKQVYWMVSENRRFESMKQKKEREKKSVNGHGFPCCRLES